MNKNNIRYKFCSHILFSFNFGNRYFLNRKEKIILLTYKIIVILIIHIILFEYAMY